MVRSVPLGCSTILAQFVTDVLDAAEDGKDLATGAAVLGAELAGEAFPVAEAPVDNQSGQARAVNRPSPGDQIGRVLQSWERAAGGSDFGLL